MRGIVIRILDNLCIVGIIMAFATGVVGVIGVPQPLFNVFAGSLIGLLGGATNLVILLAVLEVRRSIIAHKSVAIKFKIQTQERKTSVQPIHIRIPASRPAHTVVARRINSALGGLRMVWPSFSSSNQNAYKKPLVLPSINQPQLH